MNKKQVMNEKILKHGRELIDFFNLDKSTDPIKLSKRLFALESKASRIMLQYCNGAIGADDVDEREAKIEKRLFSIIPKESKNAERIFINRDPRGYTLKIKNYEDEQGLNFYFRDWGGYGIIAPDFREEK